MTAPPNPAPGPETLRVWGHFELRALVGRGGFGEVYRAWDPDLQREVGLKLLVPRSSQAEAPFEEVLREARALAAVRHPNILPVYGVDRHEGRVGFWTDFVHGRTLAALVREQGPFGYREAALIGVDVSRALSAVHRAGLLHRDIKAENVMREEGGRILLMDFGLTALSGGRREFAGTPRYMAPELLRGESATVASDFYAVGVMLFYLVTGRYPDEPMAPANSDGAAAEATATRVVRSTAPPAAASSSLLDHRPDLPDSFVRAIETAMHADPHRRFPSAGAMSSALAETLGTASAALPPGEDARRGRGSRMGRAGWIGGLSLAVILAAAALVFHFKTGQWLPGTHPPAASENVPGNLNDDYLKADALLQRYDIKKNVTDAIGLLQNVLAHDPNFALAQAGLGRAWFLEYRVTRVPGLLDRARSACNRAITLDASLAQPWVTLARIDAMAGHTDLATQEVQKALRLDPRSAEAYGAQSEVFDAEGRTADAIAAVQKAADLQPDYWRWPLILGNYDYNAGKLEDAASQYRSAAGIAPDNAIVLLNLGLVSLELNRLTEAQTYLKKSVQVQPAFAAWSTLSEVYSAEGKYQDAIQASRQALSLDQTNYLAWGNLASAYLFIPSDHNEAVKMYEKAIELAEIARKDTPQDAHLLAQLGGYYAFVGQRDRAVALLREALSLAPDDPNVLFAAGDAYEILGRRSEAIPLIARSIALGFHLNQLERLPELASLRADPRFQQALHAALQQH